MKIPSLVLRQLYTFGSLQNIEGGIAFSLKNRLSDATLTGLKQIKVNGTPLPLDGLSLVLDDGTEMPADAVGADGVPFALRSSVQIRSKSAQLDTGRHELALSFECKPFGSLEFKVKDAISSQKETRQTVPYDKVDNYSDAVIAKRQRYVEEYSGVKLQHIDKYSIDPQDTQGNIENFTGVAQIPIGFAGPIQVNGEHADGEFLVPLATTEGTLVASYNRGIKVVNLSGGVTTTVVADAMQRAPVFIFESARGAKQFEAWVRENEKEIAKAAEETSSIAKLLYIDTFLSNRFAYLRFNYSTGDAAGQNMVGRATFAACSWMLEQELPKKLVTRFYLESNLATDKKSSQINVMRTRGKRVIAECTVKREVLEEVMRVKPESLHYHSNVSTIGAFLSGANNNGAHSPNAITAIFIATGQDVANVSESSAGILYSEMTPDGDLYISLTIPSLIVATYGGGTSIGTQKECLEIMGCWGRNKVMKFAEIVAGVALAGELSLGAAISSLDWVSSHEKYGRNR
ncbi:hydroxymethylglutaryl-CoA reductase [Acidobacteria bacterium Mor1]|nr:hydroxymethylglutaryl-CoA reductase [Acidobacteria bacterium Mor1]